MGDEPYSPDTVVVQTLHTAATGPTVSRSRRPRYSAHGARGPLGSVWSLPLSCRRRPWTVDLRCRTGHKPRSSLGAYERGDGKNHPGGHSEELQLADVSTRKNLRDEEIVHVGQRVQRQGEEEEGASLLPVCGVVVPEDQDGQRRQDQDSQQVVQ